MKGLEPPIDAYLDIETTGLSPDYNRITVVGIYLANRTRSHVLQFVGNRITSDRLRKALANVDTVYTYNGSRFDLPFIYAHHNIDLTRSHKHCDLMYRCWQSRLYGGLKAVERQLGIERWLKDMNGYEAVRLWWQYVNNDDRDALTTLLNYNKEDVVNLKALKERLFGV